LFFKVTLVLKMTLFIC